MADTTFAYLDHEKAGRPPVSPSSDGALEDLSAWEAYPHVSARARAITIAGLSAALLFMVGGSAALLALPHAPLSLKIGVGAFWGANVLIATGLRNGRPR